MSSFDDIRNERLKKLEAIKNKGINPYPVSVSRDFTAAEALDDFAKLSKRKKALRLAGRLTAIRGHGGSVFFDFFDGSAKMQGYIKKDEVGAESHNLFLETADVGDFVELSGHLFVTKKKEKTLKVSKWRMLAKSLRPLPDKWHGLRDVEERYRKRYLDLLMNAEVRERFVSRSKIVSGIREFLDGNGYLEVETPILQPLAGGANAAPFITHHNALDIDLYLRIAKELYLKKLLIGGFEKIYELGRDFRNEGIDATHNPEFTMLEFYEAYSDASKQRDFVEKLIKSVAKKILKKSKISVDGGEIDFSKKFAVISYSNLLKKHALIADIEALSREDAALKARQLGVKVENSDGKEKIIDGIYKKNCLPKLVQPTFIVDYPIEFSPFAKKKEGSQTIVDRFQLAVSGMEIVNAFSELNDPIDQKERFLEQDKKKKAGDTEVSPSDDEFVEALEYGMPPAGGVGIGIDRLAMLFTGASNIKEVILFPTLKPKN